MKAWKNLNYKKIWSIKRHRESWDQAIHYTYWWICKWKEYFDEGNQYDAVSIQDGKHQVLLVLVENNKNAI